MEDMYTLYRCALSMEYEIDFWEKRLLEQAPELNTNPAFQSMAKGKRKFLASLEDKIRNHPDRPKTPEEELQFKRTVIAAVIEGKRENDGLCNTCIHYLPNTFTLEQARQWRDFPEDGVVCQKTGLQKKNPPLVVCPQYSATDDSALLAANDIASDERKWLRLQEKYAARSSVSDAPKPLRF